MTADLNNHDCIKFWDDEYEQVVNALRVVSAEKKDAEDTKRCLTEWEAALKMYWESIEETDKKAKSCSGEIGVFKSHTVRVKELTTCTVDVCEKEYCLVLDFFNSMDTLKGKMSDLKKAIDCLNNPDLNSASIVVKNLNELESKLNAAIATQKETIQGVLGALLTARDLDKSVGNNDPNTNPPDHSGLLWLLDKLNGLFDHSTQGQTASTNAEGEASSYGEGCNQPQMSCHEKLTDKPPKMPLDQDEYYTKTKEQYDKAKGEQDDADAAYNAARDKENKLNATKESLSKASQKAKAAKGA